MSEKSLSIGGISVPVKEDEQGRIYYEHPTGDRWLYTKKPKCNGRAFFTLKDVNGVEWFLIVYGEKPDGKLILLTLYQKPGTTSDDDIYTGNKYPDTEIDQYYDEEQGCVLLHG